VKQPDERISRCRKKTIGQAAFFVAEAGLSGIDRRAAASLIDRDGYSGSPVIGVPGADTHPCDVMIGAADEGRQQKTACQMAENSAARLGSRDSRPVDVVFLCHKSNPLKQWPNTQPYA
jgi:hypothetical protein